MADFTPPVRDDLVGVHSYGAPQLDVPVRLNVNENPYELPASIADAMAEAVRETARTLNRYPERDAVALRQALADYLRAESGVSVDWQRVWAANGSNEVMHHLFLAFGGPGRRAVSFDPTYSMYPEYARDTFTHYRAFPRRADFSIDVPAAVEAIDDVRPSIVVIASPNNPTGTAISLDDLAAIATAARAARAVLIVDEAYAEFRRPGVPSALELIGKHPNVIVTRTMSKAFGLAGARIGYAVAGVQEEIDTLQVVRLPYHLSAVTQAVACVALEHAGLLQAQVALIRQERDALVAWLGEQGFEVTPSDANFVLFGRFADRDALWRAMLDDGVLIRVTGPDGWLRATVGTPAENDRLRTALLGAVSANDVRAGDWTSAATRGEQ